MSGCCQRKADRADENNPHHDNNTEFPYAWALRGAAVVLGSGEKKR